MTIEGNSMDHLPTGILRLPNEILLEIVALVNPPDLRRLSKVNRRLYFLVVDRYNVGLTAFPNEIILEIIQHLGTHDRSRLARSSHRFYALVMDSILRHNVRNKRSSLLCFAAKKNLEEMARRILYRGGDVNTEFVFLLGATSERLTPLVIAAFYGYGGMVKILLESGANNYTHGKNTPLALAISQRHENVALMLLQAMDSVGSPLEVMGGATLQMASAAKLVNLVQYLLERRARLNVKGTHDLNRALYRVLLEDASTEYIFKRKLHQNVYMIVLMLLQNGASPDIRPEGEGISKIGNIRNLSSRHPDPRVRALLLKVTHSNESKDSSRQVRRSRIVSSEAKAVTSQASQPTGSYVDESRYARLGDFLGRPNAELPIITDKKISSIGKMTGDGRRDDGDCTSIASRFVDMLEDEKIHGSKKKKKDLETTEPPQLSSFPQLGAPKASTQQAARDLWASASPGVRSSGMPRIRATDVIARREKRREKPAQIEQFPQLIKPRHASNDTGKDLWAAFSKDKAAPNTREAQRTAASSVSKDEHDTERSINKVSKKKKKTWERLLI